jgi:glycosyltransferase involved in cell wall biosynthesis
MRWLFLSYSYEPGLRPDAGGFRKLWELAHALRGQGHEVLVLYPRLPGFAPLRDVPAQAYPVVDAAGLRPASAFLARAAAALRAGRRHRPDVVYFRTGVDVLPVAVGRALGARVVLEVNADPLEFLRGEKAPGWRIALARAAERRSARGSDLVVALTPGLRETLVARHGLDPGRVRVIPSGTDPAHFRPAEPGPARGRLGLPPDAPVVGFIGLFYRHQGVATLVDAMPRVRAALPAAHALLVGDGALREAWQARARALGVEAAVRFTGQVPYAEAPGALAAMDVVAAPFTADRGEASPFKVLDALAAGRPVVASDLPAVRSLAAATGGVTLVPPDDPAALADAVVALLRDPARRGREGAAGRAGVTRHFAWPVLAGELAATLEPRVPAAAAAD